jgi:hypothetical protein
LVDTEYGKVPTVLSAYVLPTIRAAAGPWPSSESRHLCPALWSLRLTDSVCGTAPCAVGRRQGGTVAPRTPTSEKPEIEGREVRTQRPARRVSQPQRQRQPSHGVSQRRDRDSEQGTRDDLAPRRHASLRAPARPRDRLAVRSRTAMIGISRPLMVLVMLMLMRARSALSRRVCLPSRPRAPPASPSLAECQSSHSCLVL